jgi:hypothetical protein
MKRILTLDEWEDLNTVFLKSETCFNYDYIVELGNAYPKLKNTELYNNMLENAKNMKQRSEMILEKIDCVK